MTKLKDKDHTLIDLSHVLMAQTGTWIQEYGRSTEDRPAIRILVGTTFTTLNYYNTADRDHDYELIANRDATEKATGAFSE